MLFDFFNWLYLTFYILMCIISKLFDHYNTKWVSMKSFVPFIQCPFPSLYGFLYFGFQVSEVSKDENIELFDCLFIQCIYPVP